MPDHTVALDSSAILAVLLSEPGGSRVTPVLHNGVLSTVNLAEVHTVLLRRGEDSLRAWRQITALPFEICPLTQQQARTVAEIESATRRFGLSLGDRACLALAVERNAKVFTTDRTWKNLSLGIEIEVIR
ncbi:MAG: type II toxin-antitoxin system VapC family toxin [Terracidiphilus sp.]